MNARFSRLLSFISVVIFLSFESISMAQTIGVCPVASTEAEIIKNFESRGLKCDYVGFEYFNEAQTHTALVTFGTRGR